MYVICVYLVFFICNEVNLTYCIEAFCCSVSLTLLHIAGVPQIAPVCLIITWDRNLLGPAGMYNIWLNINSSLYPVTVPYFTYSILLQPFYSSVFCKSLLMPSLSAEMYETVFVQVKAKKDAWLKPYRGEKIVDQGWETNSD